MEETENVYEVPQLKAIVTDNIATFLYIRNGYAYYSVRVKGLYWMFPVEISDLGGATIHSAEKAITLMRYIRKALTDGSFVKAI